MEAFSRLKEKTRAVFILHIAGFNNNQLARLIGVSFRTVTRYIKKGYDEYTDIKRKS